MATKIRLRRVGRRKQATFRIVVSGESHAPEGRFTEQIGKYNPRTNPSFIEVDEERALHWIRQGAEVTDTVRSLFRKTGILAKAAQGGEPEGVVRIGDVDGRTIFPVESSPQSAAVATVTRTAPAEEAEAEADEPAEESAAEAEAPASEAAVEAPEAAVEAPEDAVEAPEASSEREEAEPEQAVAEEPAGEDGDEADEERSGEGS